tara:strand:- start:3438 stop:4577 length:1140 start_codon:yes stop_codon:yes gene_type:complete
MAITRLTDLITVFESKWTFGDVKFGYESDVNEDHDTQYPLMLIQPPSSIIPAIYNGREEYEFEINFYNLYSQAAQSVVTLQKRWDNLQDMSMEWFDMVLKNYQDVNVEAYLNDESLEIERVKEVANDRLVQIKMTFTMSAFTKCFRPVSIYPSNYSDLVIWLRADSGATFDIPTQRVSAWADQSGNNNSVAESTATKQPLRYGYDGADDKAYINFNGTTNQMVSNSNSPMSSNSFTAFLVTKQHTADTNIQRIFNYSKGNEANIVIGCKDNKFYFNVNNNSSPLVGESINVGDSLTDYFLVKVQFTASGGLLKMSINGGADADNDIAGWDTNIVFNETTFDIGRYAKADIAEFIVYNRVLSSTEITEVKDYLNTKFKIY